MLKFIVKLHPEIAIKSKSVRKRFTKVLEKNIKMLLVRVDENVKVKNNWDNISVTSELSDEKTRLGL
ncbi:tRNA 4-thiouridine(8) synthase ThiI, partial [Pseudoalteromonas phenolica]